MAGYELYTPCLYSQATPGAALASSTTLTDISTNPQYVLAPGKVTTVGQGFHIVAAGVYSDTGSPTLILGAYKNTQTTGGGTAVGGAAIAASSTITAGATQTNLPWFLDLYVVFNAVGASATAFAYGQAWVALTTTTTNPPLLIPFTTPQTAGTWNLTVPNILGIGAQWSANSPSNSIICNLFNVQLLNN